MSNSFSFPPPPPPPPPPHSSKRDPASIADIRGGFRGRANGRGQASRGASHSFRSNHIRDNSFRGRGPVGRASAANSHKRDHATAFSNHPPNRPKAPPAVPSFDIDIKSLLPEKAASAQPKRTSSKSNLLGLTPATADTSESEDDIDDEAKLAVFSDVDGLKFEHKGQKLSLRTPDEVQAWIAERKKRYPTQVRIDAAKRDAEEKKKQWEEQHRVRREALHSKKVEREKARSDRERQRLKEKVIAVQIAKSKSTTVAAPAVDEDHAMATANKKAERLRKKAERIAKSLKATERFLESRQLQVAARIESIPNEEAETEANASRGAVDTSDNSEDDDDDDDNSHDDDTSSSGSSDTEASSSSEPEEAPSKLSRPERVTPAKQVSKRERAGKDVLCKSMVKLGRCKFGKKCRFSHQISGEKRKQLLNDSTKRKGLYQVLVEKEQKEEMERALKVIITLGEQGLLDGSLGRDNMAKVDKQTN